MHYSFARRRAHAAPGRARIDDDFDRGRYYVRAAVLRHFRDADHPRVVVHRDVA